MNEYEEIRQKYRPEHIKLLLLAESPPPPPDFQGARHFYRTDRVRNDDRLFLNTIWALYPEAEGLSIEELENDKEKWLRRLQQDGTYMTECLEETVIKKVDKKERRRRLEEAVPRIIERVGELVDKQAGIILIKSNPFDIVAQPLKDAGFNVLNEALVDFPGVWNQKAYKEKLAALVKKSR